jgi:predicted nucleic acid-binding protein
VKPVFVDTSAILALLVADDPSHAAASRAFTRAKKNDVEFVTTSYVLVETYALLGRRLGQLAAQRFRNELAPLFSVRWVDETLHDEGLDLLEEDERRNLSLVDAVSFAAARERGVETVFAFDRHFVEAGFQLLA